MSLSPIEQLPRDIIDEILSFVRDFENDDVCVTTLYSLTLTCRSFFHAAIPALYYDPTRALWRWSRPRPTARRQRITQLRSVLDSQPHLASHVRRLTQLATFYSAELRSQIAGEDVYRIIVACRNVEELDMPVRLQGSVLFAAFTASTLPHLRHLVLDPTILGRDANGSINIDNISPAQDFIRNFRTLRNRLDSLTLREFEAVNGTDPDHPLFILKALKLQFTACTWSLIDAFIPVDPTTLKVLEITSTDSNDIYREELDRIRVLVAPSVRRFMFRHLMESTSISSIGVYDRSSTWKQGFEFDRFFVDPFPELEELVLEGLNPLAIADFVQMSSTCPSLRIVSFANTSWDPDEWSLPESNYPKICNAISMLPQLRRLHLGDLPLAHLEIATSPVQQYCDKNGIDLVYQPRRDPPPIPSQSSSTKSTTMTRMKNSGA